WGWGIGSMVSGVSGAISSTGSMVSGAASSTSGIVKGAISSTGGAISSTGSMVSGAVFSLFSTLQSKGAPETAQKIVSTQKTDGSIQLNTAVSDKIGISTSNLKTTVESYNISDNLKNIPQSAWETALSIRYLTISSQSQDQSNQYKEHSDKAKE